MRKIVVMIVLATLLLSGIGTASISEFNADDSLKSLNVKLHCSKLSISESNNDFVLVVAEESNTYLSSVGKPLLPKMLKTFELPFGATDISVSVNPLGESTLSVDSYVKPSSAMLPLSESAGVSKSSYNQMDMQIYSSDCLYPESLYSVKTGCGLNKQLESVTFVTVEWYPVQYNPVQSKLVSYESAEITLSYEPAAGSVFVNDPVYDLVIIAPAKFSDALLPLVEHKNGLGIETTVKTVEDIYDEYEGVDEAEQIKYFIKDAKESFGVSYVLLVGGLKSMIHAKPKDNCNIGARGWYVPVRYSNMYDDPAFPLSSDSIHDPGVIVDLYYADIYEAGGAFSSWDPNGDGQFLAMGKPGVEDDEDIDFYPDVSLSRLPCRSVSEVETVVGKIITYESSSIDPSWFEKMIVVSGDGFLDQEDLAISWDTSSVADGDYTIYAQSKNPLGEHGPISTVSVIKDRSSESTITYSHDDNLNPAIVDAFANGFPTVPIAEIVSVSEGDVLGNTDVEFDPESNDYCNEFFFWANVSYIDEILTIRGKSYDPKPYGNVTSIHVWVEGGSGSVVFEDWRNDTEMYYEGEWTTGEKELLGRGGALYYMPEVFEKEILWASNGKLTGMDDVLSAVSEGCGFLFFSGHGSPNVWADQYPGIPGDRGPASVTGMQVTTLRPYPPFFSSPMFPMDTLSNEEKLPIAVVGGCHNSQFNVSMILGVYDLLPYLLPMFPEKSMWCHGVPVPETFSWRLVRNPDGGAIASMGNTGLGYGMPGKELTTGGGDSWITIEFFRQYGEENLEVLGDAYLQTLNSYVDTFDMSDLSAGHPKTVSQWVLFGDPTLKIGGYE